MNEFFSYHVRQKPKNTQILVPNMQYDSKTEGIVLIGVHADQPAGSYRVCCVYQMIGLKKWTRFLRTSLIKSLPALDSLSMILLSASSNFRILSGPEVTCAVFSMANWNLKTPSWWTCTNESSPNGLTNRACVRRRLSSTTSRPSGNSQVRLWTFSAAEHRVP